MVSTGSPFGIAHPQNAEEGAERHHDIDRHVEQHRRGALRAARGEPDQREADIVDRGIGEQPLDVGLAVGGDRAEEDRGERGEDHDLPPGVGRGAEGVEARRASTSSTPATFGAEAKKAVTGVGAPS